MSHVTLRPSREEDLDFITSLERHPDNRDLIGQWSDDEHRAAIAGADRWSHWLIERAGAPAGYLVARDCARHGAGTYVKRVLVAEKERGTGKDALRAFIDATFASGSDAVWLIVRNENARAQAVYRQLGFERFRPSAEEAHRFDAIAEAPAERCFRMRLRK